MSKVMEKIYVLIYKDGMTQKEACKKHGVPETTFATWKWEAHPKTPRRKIKKWEEDDYNTVLDAMQLGIKQKEACKDIGMPVSTFSVWFKKYKEENGYEKSVDYI